jgi:hypothetical protein
MVTRILDVLHICIPVFMLIGLGRVLTARGIMTASHRGFLNGLIYHLALPCLIFAALVRQPVAELLNGALIVSTVSATLLVTLLYAVCAALGRLRGGVAAAFVFGTFWANVSYIGFPLSMNAFGQQQGLAMAAVVNAFAMPAFVIIGHILIGLYARGDARGLGAAVGKGIGNPIVLSAIAGLGCAWALSVAPVDRAPAWLTMAGSTVMSFLELAGDMGLPVALLCVGSALKLSAVQSAKPALVLVVGGKLILTPLITLILLSVFFPHAAHAARGVAVLLMATPTAVASYVIATKHGVAQDFVAAMLVVSTLLSMITIPVWLFFLT